MADYDPINLGRAVTSLGLDFDFLSKGGLEGFSVPEKSQLVNGIVDENLKRGKWQAVLALIYKGYSNADVLYDGDRSKLRDRILESAQRCPGSLAEKTITILKDKGEQELLFRLATEAPFDYETLGFLKNSIGDYLSDPEQRAQRTKTLNLVLGNAAFKHKNFEHALRYFEEVEDTEGIGKIFEATVSGKEISYEYSRGDIVERAALADPTQKERRLKRLVLAAIRKRNINPWKAFQIFKKYDVPLSLLERSILYNRAAEKISTHEIEEANDYGKDVLKAAISGIKCEREYDRLSPDQISVIHLKKLLSKAPFDIRIKIAGYFKDEEALKSLSRKALANGNLDEAYNLWIEGKGNLEDPDISKVRTKLITGKVSGSERFFLDFRKDPVGAVEYCDALMNAGDFREAHEVALNLKDEERAQRTREKMLEGDLEKTLSFFADFGGEAKDRKGIEQVAERVAETHNVPTELVREIIEKHHRYIRK